MPSSPPLKPRKRVSKPGSFLEICLAPDYYTYARKLPDRPRYTFYNELITKSQRDVIYLHKLPALFTTSLLGTPSWPVVGQLPLDRSEAVSYRSWHAKPLFPTPEQMALGIRPPETEYFLVEETRDPLTGYWDTKETPAQQAELRGLTRHASYRPEYIEEKLRLHYGLTVTGQRVEPILFNQQKLW